MSTAAYLIDGMNCGYCMGKVHEKVRSLSGVTKVAIDLVAGGQSPLLVMSGNKLGKDAVRRAVESAGFGLLRPRGPDLHPDVDSPSNPELGIHQDHQRAGSAIGGVRS